MRITSGTLSLAAALIAFTADADSLRDLSLRIDYAYYSGDAAVLDAAADELGSMKRRDMRATYLHAFAQYRMANLDTARSEPAAALTACRHDAEQVAEEDDTNVAALVLVAACSLRLAEVEPLKSVLHERRALRALQLARDLDPSDPTLAYVESLAYRHDGADDRVYEAALTRALDLYAQSAARGESEWGEPEAQVALAARHIAAGDLRRARDAVEAALLVAPGYIDALELRERLHAGAD